MKKESALFTDFPEDTCNMADSVPAKKSRRRGFSYKGFIERVLSEYEAGKLPIRNRPRDCELVGLTVRKINDLHAANETEKLQQYMAQLFRSVVFLEDLEKE